jgi:hypothetical protein
MIRLVSTADAASMMGVEPSTLRDWRCSRKGPAFIVISPRKVVYAVEDIQRYVDERRQVPSVQAGEVHANAAL